VLGGPGSHPDPVDPGRVDSVRRARDNEVPFDGVLTALAAHGNRVCHPAGHRRGGVFTILRIKAMWFECMVYIALAARDFFYSIGDFAQAFEWEDFWARLIGVR